MITIDITKQYQTRNGFNVFGLDVWGSCLVGWVGLEDQRNTWCSWNLEGRFNAPYPEIDSRWDLIPVD